MTPDRKAFIAIMVIALVVFALVGRVTFWAIMKLHRGRYSDRRNQANAGSEAGLE